MARTIPTTEPASVRAGDSWQWTKTLSDFPASTWTLTYTLFSSTDVLSVSASADGADHSVDVAPATTGAYTAGWYDWIAQVTDGTDTHTVGKGRINVLPDVASASTYDGRSHARKMLDYLTAIIEGRASDETISVVRASSPGVDVTYKPDLEKLRAKYAAAVRTEDDQIAVANGQNTGRFIGTRFVG